MNPQLPVSRNSAGRPLWEPPILDYSDLIDEEYEKKRKAVLEHTNGDVVKTTAIMDVNAEDGLFYRYWVWAGDNITNAANSESEDFFIGLKESLWEDWQEVHGSAHGRTTFEKNDDGSYRVKAVLPWFPDASSPEEESRAKDLHDSTDDSNGNSGAESHVTIQQTRNTASQSQNQTLIEHHGVFAAAIDAERLAQPLALQLFALRSLHRESKIDARPKQPDISCAAEDDID